MHEGIDQRSKDDTPAQQQRPESPTVTLTWHASKYKVHKLHQRYALCHYTILRVPGEIKRREVELDPQVSPEEIMSREMELGCESWTSFASGCSSAAVQRTLSL